MDTSFVSARLEQKKMCSSIPLSGSYHDWASDAAKLLLAHEKRFPAWQRGEIISRGLSKLSRQSIGSSAQLHRLIPSVVDQVLADLIRSKLRDESRIANVDASLLSSPSPGLPEAIQDRLEQLLGHESPLDPLERQILEYALIDPRRYIYPNGQLRQKALGKELGVDQKTVFNRWVRIRRKAARLKTGISPASEITL
jgi:hypothetical protein